MIVSDADATPSIVAAHPQLTLVITLTDPDGSVPDLADRSGTFEHVVFEVKDLSMETDTWVVRFGGDATDLFQREDADAVIALASGHSLDNVLVHCGQGISRSTAVAMLLAAAAGHQPAVAVAMSVAAQQASFQWRHRAAWIPNERILRIGSEALYGDDRLGDAARHYRDQKRAERELAEQETPVS